MSAWGCPHLGADGTCVRVRGRRCQLGMKGCVLAGRFVFADQSEDAGRDQEALPAPRPEDDRDER